MTKKSLFLSFALSLGLLTACDNKFDEANLNPNDPTSVPAERLMPHGIYTTVNGVIGTLGLDVGSGWAQHTARIQYTEIDQFSFTSDTQDTPWRNLYNESLADFQKIIELGKAGGNENYQAIGLIMRAYTFSVLTDVYGDIPYSEALKGTTAGIVAPKFDMQKDVYAGLVADLKTASDLINSKTVSSEGDILFGANMTKWKKFANSLSLRLLNRMVGKSGLSIDPKSEMTRILNDPTKYPVMTSNADNAQLVYLARPNNNPINENRRTRDDHRVSATMMDKLVSLSDPRLAVYASKAADTGEYKGVPNGLSNSEASALGLSKTSKIGTYFVQETTPGVLMSYAELNFIKAEAAFIKGDKATALAAYRNGISAHLTYAGVSTADQTTYLANAAVLPAASSLTLSQIMLQKYIAQWGWGFLEQWSDLRRYNYSAEVFTGFQLPQTFATANNGKPAQRLRPRYNSEYVWNIDALAKIGGLELDYHTKPVWFSQP